MSTKTASSRAEPGSWLKELSPSLVIGPLGIVGTFALTLFGLLLITFLIGRVLPIDPTLAILGDRALPEAYERVRRELGLDQPVAVQFWMYIGQVLRGDFGTSVLTSRPVLQDLARFFPATFELATSAILIGIVFGIPLGVLAATHQGRRLDHLTRIVGLLGYSVPIFWLGLVSLLVFYAKLRWVPGPGRLDVYYSGLIPPVTGLMLIDSLIAGNLQIFRNAVGHLVLPAMLLGGLSISFISRMTRSFALDQLRQEYVVTARAKGASELRIVCRHVLPNIAIPLLNVVILSYASLIEGSVLTETVFSWPGLGLYITNSLFSADLNAVLGSTTLVGTILVCLNLTADQINQRIAGKQ